MKQVAKVLIIDNEGYYLLLERANHPTFLNDPDLPGGIIEEGEEPLEAAIREVVEEASISLDSTDVQHMYTGSEYSAHDTEYSLYIAHTAERPIVTTSWEHASFAWVNREEFLKQAREANDTYMHMVYNVMNSD
jgi:8-oxo-dGTP diphosphatase